MLGDYGRQRHRSAARNDHAVHADGVGASQSKISALAQLVAELQAPSKRNLDLVDAAVFWRRVSYQLTLWSLIVLLLMPFDVLMTLGGTAGGCQGRFEVTLAKDGH